MRASCHAIELFNFLAHDSSSSLSTHHSALITQHSSLNSVADGSSVHARIGGAKTHPALGVDKNCVAIPYAVASFDPVPPGSQGLDHILRETRLLQHEPVRNPLVVDSRRKDRDLRLEYWA